MDHMDLYYGNYISCGHDVLQGTALWADLKKQVSGFGLEEAARRQERRYGITVRNCM